MNVRASQDVRVAIVGGGFTGAVCAVELARSAPRPLSIDVLEPRATVGAGLAYGSCEPEHRINVPSDVMSVFPDDPTHFTRWLKESGAWDADPAGLTDDGAHYSRRRDYGAYVADLFARSAADNPSRSTIRHRRVGATALDGTAGGWRIRDDAGHDEDYGHVVLAASYGAPRFPWRLTGDAGGLGHLIRDPWNWPAIKAIPRDARVVLIGSGLTACDVAVTLRANGHEGPIHAISRRALTPRRHGEFDRSFDLFAGIKPPASALGLLRLVRSRAREADAQGRGWHVVVDSLRRRLATYWRTLPLRERRKIAGRLRPFWDVHRFRIAPQVAALMANGLSEGWLRIDAGRIDAIEGRGGGFAIEWTARNGEAAVLEADAIVNCTGPDGDLSRTSNPMLAYALETGAARPDDLRAGIDVDESGRVLGATGEITAGLWAAGPAARAVVGEATGAPEAAAHARLVAQALTASLEPQAAAAPPFSTIGSM